MDIAKYMMTALLLSSVFGEMDKPMMTLLVSLGISVTLLSGLYLIRSVEENDGKQKILKNKKKGR